MESGQIANNECKIVHTIEICIIRVIVTYIIFENCELVKRSEVNIELGYI